MKPTQITDLLNNIKATFISFFSIMMFVALAVGIFLGLSWAGPAMQVAADKCFNENNLHNVQVQFPYGLTDEDIQKVAEVEGVTDVEPLYTSFQRYVYGDNPSTLKVQSLTERISVPFVVEGIMPAEDDEIAVSAQWAKANNISIGDVITFDHDAGDMNIAALIEGSDSEGKASGASKKDSDGMAYLKRDTFTVSAIANSAEYLSTNTTSYGVSTIGSGSIDGIAWIMPSAFDASSFFKAYPTVNIEAAGLVGLSTFGQSYKDASKALVDRVKEVGKDLSNARYQSLHQKAKNKIDDAQSKIDKANKDIADAEKKVTDGTAKIQDAKKQLEDGKAQLAEKKAQYEKMKAEGEAKLESGYDELVVLQDKYDEGKAKYDEGKAKYDDAVSSAEGLKSDLNGYLDEDASLEEALEKGEIKEATYEKKMNDLVNRTNNTLGAFASKYGLDIPTVTSDNFIIAVGAALIIVEEYRSIPVDINGENMTLDEAEEKLAEAKDKLDSGKDKLDEGWAKYYSGVAELEAGTAQAEAMIAEAENKISEGEKKISDGKAEIEKAKDKIADGKKKVAEQTDKLNKARDKFGEMKNYDWTVLDRQYNGGIQAITVMSDVMSRTRFTMAGLFLIVGLLVCYSAVSRIVHEQITQIGTKKALGLRNREITMSFLAYSGIAVIAGALIGVVVGIFIVQGILSYSLGKQWILGPFEPYWDIPMSLLVTGVELVLVLGSTWLACRGILRDHAVELLKGEKPPTGKTRFFEKWKIWERLPLYTQTIVNNCLNERRRVFSTIVGVAGCTALIVTAVTLNDNVLDSYTFHYEDVYNFNAIGYLATEEDAEKQDKEANDDSSKDSANSDASASSASASSSSASSSSAAASSSSASSGSASSGSASASSGSASSGSAAASSGSAASSSSAAAANTAGAPSAESAPSNSASAESASSSASSAESASSSSASAESASSSSASADSSASSNSASSGSASANSASGESASAASADSGEIESKSNETKMVDPGPSMALLLANGCTSTPVYRASVSVEMPDGTNTAATLTIPEDEDEFSEFYHVTSIDGSKVDLSTSEGAWLTQAYGEHRNVKVGDTVTVKSMNGQSYTVPVAGFYVYHLTSNEILMDGAYYAEVTKGIPDSNALLVNTNGAPVDEIRDLVYDKAGITELSDDCKAKSAMFNSFSNISASVVLIYLGLSAAMAVIVLLNLNVMFIEEKKRELIVLMINGFSVKDAKRYIYNDTIVLTIIGIILGLVLGSVMGIISVASVEPDHASFLKIVDWKALLAGTIGAGVLAFIMSAIALRRIPRFNLTDINRF